MHNIGQCFSNAGPWSQLYRAAFSQRSRTTDIPSILNTGFRLSAMRSSVCYFTMSSEPRPFHVVYNGRLTNELEMTWEEATVT